MYLEIILIAARIKRHSWHRISLKTRDPIIISVGWRRYQIRPIYVQEVGWRRLQRIHCVPEHDDCLAMFWGPLAPPDSGVVAVYNLEGNKAVFRISATGVILDFTQAAEIVAKIVKKCKKVRTPLKIFEETALTKDMFTSDLEIDWFEGAAVQGNDKKAAQEKLVVELIRKGDQPREGIASCSLQHKISLSDQVFMRVWDQVGELKGSRDCNGQGMETVGEVNDSLDKDDPARKQSTIEHRRSLVFSKSNVRFGRFL